MNIALPANAALLLVDIQHAIDDPSWGPRNHPEAERQAGRLLAAWREAGAPVVHIRHDSVEPGSTYRPGQHGHTFKPDVMPQPGETVFGKHTNSAFIGTGLAAHLADAGIGTLVICGVSTSNSVQTTVRMAGNLGYRVWLAEDAAFCFDITDRAGRHYPADAVHDLCLAMLEGEYCSVACTDALIAALATAR